MVITGIRERTKRRITGKKREVRYHNTFHSLGFFGFGCDPQPNREWTILYSRTDLYTTKPES